MNKYLTGLIILVVFLYFVSKFKIKNGQQMNSTPKKNFTETDAQNGIHKVAEMYGKNIAQKVEQMMRLETGNFKSEQYRRTGTGGMEAGNWGKVIPKSATSGTLTFTDNQSGKKTQYIVWNSVMDFCIFLAEYIKRHKGDWAQWNGLTPERKAEYTKRVNKQPILFT